MQKMLNKQVAELKEEAAYFAAEFNSTATNFSINGNDGYLYISIEEFENRGINKSFEDIEVTNYNSDEDVEAELNIIVDLDAQCSFVRRSHILNGSS